MPNFKNPLEALRYHVTGAIERGEGTPIVEQRNDILTINSAKQYVHDYHRNIGESVDIEGAGLITIDGIPVCRMNCIVSDVGGSFVAQWDVWVEKSDLYGNRLYGEF